MVALTGHLGAGKTTVLNHLLLHPGARVGVIVNDFGEINVDAGLISGQVGDVGSIAGGCVYCLEGGDDLDAALEQLVDPRLRLDVVVVEASGIAEPASLARMLRYSGVERVRLGGVVEVVDAVNDDALLGAAVPPARFAAATLVVLNKADLLPSDAREERLTRLEDRIREVNPAVHVVRTSRGHLDPTLVFDAAAGTLGATPEDPEGQLPIEALLREAQEERRARRRSAGADRDDHAHDDHHHAASVAVRTTGPVDPHALVALLEDPPPGAYRLKGTVAVETGRSRRGYVAHVVGRHVHVLPATAPDSSEMVAIGVGLDTTAARERLERALAPAGRCDADGYRTLERLRRLSE